MKVLIIRLSAIGDTIHCLPVVSLLKKRIPDVQIGWVVEPLSAPLVMNNPAIDEVFVLPRKEWLKKLGSPAKWSETIREFKAFWNEIQSKQYDVVLDMQGLMKSALCAVLSGAPRRIGFSQAREGAGLFLTDKVDVGNYFGHDRHVIRLNLDIAGHLLKEQGFDSNIEDNDVEFPLPVVLPPSEAHIDDLLKTVQGSGRSSEIVVLLPGSTWPSKNWEMDKWVELGHLLVSQLGSTVIIAGGPSEKKTNEKIATGIRALTGEDFVVDITGKTSLVDLIALYKKCRLVVGADSGPMHLAAATGKPRVIAVFGSTPWRRLGPWGKGNHAVSLSLDCQPCYTEHCPLSTNACLKELSAMKVLEQAKSLL